MQKSRKKHGVPQNIHTRSLSKHAPWQARKKWVKHADLSRTIAGHMPLIWGGYLARGTPFAKYLVYMLRCFFSTNLWPGGFGALWVGVLLESGSHL